MASKVDVAERPDRARDEDVSARDFSSLACQLHAGAHDGLEFVFEEMLCELRTARTERVRLDEVGPGADVPEMNFEDALGCAQVRLFRAAQPRDGTRKERTHAAVRDDRRSGPEPLEEPAQGIHLMAGIVGTRAEAAADPCSRVCNFRTGPRRIGAARRMHDEYRAAVGLHLSLGLG